MEKFYYLDSAATTRVFDEEFDLMKLLNENYFFNPSAQYKQAISSKKILDEARENICSILGGKDGNLLFTSSATESNNMVFNCLHLRAGQEVLISAGEHPSVFASSKLLEKKGIVVKLIPIDKTGKVDEGKFVSMLNEKVALVSFIHVSNETGAINDIKKLTSIVKSFNKNIIVHSDGVQAFGKIKVNLRDLGVDLYTISAHKIYAPRGIAALWFRKNVVIDPLLVGGGQENGLRSSTENMLGAASFSFAATKLDAEREKNFELVTNLKNEFLRKLFESDAGKFLKLNSVDGNSPYIISLSFLGVKGEVLAHALELDGVLISTGSACSAKKAGNRVLEAMGIDSTQIIGSVRISFSAYENYDLNEIVEIIVKNVLRFEKNNL